MWTILTSQWCHFSFISYTRSLRETGDTRIFITNYSVPLRELTAIARGRDGTQWNLYLAVCHFPLHFSVHIVFHFHFLSAHIIIMCDIREENLYIISSRWIHSNVDTPVVVVEYPFSQLDRTNLDSWTLLAGAGARVHTCSIPIRKKQKKNVISIQIGFYPSPVVVEEPVSIGFIWKQATATTTRGYQRD